MAKRVRQIEDVPFTEMTEKKEDSAPIDVTFNQQDAQFEEIPSASSSPLNEPVKTRTGGDDFLKSQTSAQNQLGPNPFMHEGDAEEFKVEDEESLLMKQQEVKMEDVDKETINETSDMLTNILVDVFAMVVPVATDAYHRIPEKVIAQYEKQDKLPEGTIDHIRKMNSDNKTAVTIDKAQKEMIKKPLAKLLEAKGAKTKPEWVLAIAIIAVIVISFIKSHAIRKENDLAVLNYIESYAKAKEKAKRDADREEASHNSTKEVVTDAVVVY